METRQQAGIYPFLQGGGEMGELTRLYDWSGTSIGEPGNWPHTLQNTVSIILRSRFPMFLWWGDEMIQFYNDAYRPSLGVTGKHPRALGQNGADCWPEIWEIISPLHEQVRTSGEATWSEDQLVPIYRNNTIEEVYWTFSYSAVLDDEGRHGGILVTCMETTAAVLNQRKLMESESRFRNIIEQAPISIALTRGADLVFESINPPMLQMIDKNSREEVIGRPLLEVLPELASQPVFDIIRQVLQTGQTFKGNEVEAELLKEGVLQRRYYDITYSRLVDQQGPAAVLHMAIDVTDQVLAKRKKEESEVKLRSILNSAPTAMGVFVGPDLILENPNQLLIDVMAAGPDIEGKSFRQLLSGLVEEDQKFIALIDTVRRTGEAFEAQEVEVFFKAEQRTRYFNISFIPLRNDSGQVYAVLDVSVDVTRQVLTQKNIQQKEAELANAFEQLRLSKEAAELGTFDLDLQAGRMHWDSRCRILFGISHKGPVTFEKDFVHGLHPDDRERILRLIDNAFDKAKTDGEYDVEYRTIGAEDGIERWVKAKGKVYFDNADKPVRFIGSVLDITPQMTAMHRIEGLVQERTRELGEAYESLQTINKELQRSNQNLEEFAHAASHDLKEPVRKIHFFTSQLKSQLAHQLGEGELRSFNRIESAAERMRNLIDDLLLYSHASQRPHDTQEVDLHEVLLRVIEDLEIDIDEKQATILLETLPVLQGYRRQLQQLFQNQLTNALKYSRENTPPEITIAGSTITENDRAYHYISVSDNGIGFEQQYEHKIFQMFSRLHGRDVYSGTGVGLSIVKKVVENHDGFIRVQSTPGKGSTFSIYLPIKRMQH